MLQIEQQSNSGNKTERLRMAQRSSPTIILEGLENLNVPDLSDNSVRFSRVNIHNALSPVPFQEGNNISKSHSDQRKVTEPVEEGSALNSSSQSELSAQSSQKSPLKKSSPPPR